MNVLTVLGEQDWLADCKATMRTALLCVGRAGPTGALKLPQVLMGHILCEVLLVTVWEKLHAPFEACSFGGTQTFSAADELAMMWCVRDQYM